jgi:thioredoxin 1
METRNEGQSICALLNMNRTFEITEANFETEVLKSKEPVLLDFWAEWRMLAPALGELAIESRGRFKIGTVNVNANPRLALWYGIQCIPTMLYFVKGEVRDRIVGVIGKQAILAKLNPLHRSMKSPRQRQRASQNLCRTKTGDVRKRDRSENPCEEDLREPATSALLSPDPLFGLLSWRFGFA